MNANTPIPKTIDAILDELSTRVSKGPDRDAQHAVERVTERKQVGRPGRGA